MRAEIITIGDEILIGQITDTNSAWIAEQFNLNGIEIYQITSVHDDADHIKDALSKAEENVDLVILTGGLGPTRDDITKNALCEYFNTVLVFHEPTFEHIKQRFKNRNIDVNKLNRDQALVPESCQVLFNREGTAPGMWFERSDTIFISVPGVPFEMKNLVTDEILPRLRMTGKARAIYHRTVLTQGLPESILAERIEHWESSLPGYIKLAYLPNPMSVRLRLSATGTDINLLKNRVAKEIEGLMTIIPDHIYGFDNETIAEVVGRLLKKNGKTLSVAESCTGGYISHLITSVAGCSEYYRGGIIAYSNIIKENSLAVSPENILTYGAVSEPVVKEMAGGARRLFQTDYSVATSGIAGPDGGTPDKPVGTVWIAVAGPDEILAEKFIFGGNRERNIIRSGQTALQMLRRMLIKI
ncbi:MAG: competence/damage-inducible protein A [Prolixibacteraceae bacterium]|nr:competence/damage-inducible protein A [Prolixibacteraceae bacterium]